MEVVWSGAWLAREAGWLYIAGAGWDVSPPQRFGHAANVDERLQREGTGYSDNAGACPRSRTSTGGGLRWGQAHARTVPFWPRPDRSCCCGSGVGERQGGVMGDGSRVVARCGSRRRALACTRAKQNAKRQPERVETHARHRVHTRSPGWHGRNDTKELPNLVNALDRAVFSLGELMAHA